MKVDTSSEQGYHTVSGSQRREREPWIQCLYKHNESEIRGKAERERNVCLLDKTNSTIPYNLNKLEQFFLTAQKY